MARMFAAATLEEARAALAAGARAAAGMTLLALEWRAAPPAGEICDLSRLAALRGVTASVEGLRIGALTTLEALRRDARLAAGWPALATLLGDIGSAGVRAQATVGGNLAWEGGDLRPAFLAAGAVIERQGSLIEAVRLPHETGTRLFVEKIGHREAFSPTLVVVAGAVRLSGGRFAALRLAVGGGPTRAQCLPRSEAALIGADPAALDWQQLAERLAAEIVAGDDNFATAAHRARVAGRALAYHLTALA